MKKLAVLLALVGVLMLMASMVPMPRNACAKLRIRFVIVKWSAIS